MTTPGDDIQFRELCDNLGVALIATDRAFSIILWNAAAGRMFGAGADRMIGTNAFSVFPADRRDAAEQMFQRAIDSGETTEIEFHYRDDNGRPVELAGAIAPVVSATGERVGASICIRDITRRIRLQAEILESRKMTSLGQMAGAISHHFNNILGGVVTSIDYAAAAADDPTVTRRILHKASKSILRATSLVNGLLVFAEGGPREDDLGDLTEVLNHLAHELEQATSESSIRFDFGVPALPVVPVPRTQLLTVLRNISENAVEAMPDGGTLRVSAAVGAESVNVTISDTGRGLSDEERGRIFEPFWTTKGPATEGPASGLGLAIAHGIIQVLGGTISVESEPQKGSSFTVTIPVSTQT